MSHIYGDIVVYVQKQPDGTLRRSNAIVLASSLQRPTAANRAVIEGAPVEEHLDLAFPALVVPPGAVLKTRNFDEIFRPVYSARKYSDGLASGWDDYFQLITGVGHAVEVDRDGWSFATQSGDVGVTEHPLDETPADAETGGNPDSH